jgi:hypothetical protein
MIPKSVFSEKIMLKQSARAIVSVGTLRFAHPPAPAIPYFFNPASRATLSQRAISLAI